MDGFKVEFNPGYYSRMAVATVSFEDEWAVTEFLQNLQPIWVIRGRSMVNDRTVKVEFGCDRTISEVFMAAYEAAVTAKKVCRWPKPMSISAAAAD